MDDHEEHDEELDHDQSPFEGVYILDDDTADLVATAIGVLQMTAGVQLGEDHRENLMIIAEELAQRFGLVEDINVEEVTHGDEILYKPLGGVMGDDEDTPEQAEGPAVDSE